jgi:hypothetical protein
MALEDVVKVDKGSKGRGGGRGGGGGVMRGRGGAGNRGARAAAPYQVRASPLAASTCPLDARAYSMPALLASQLS